MHPSALLVIVVAAAAAAVTAVVHGNPAASTPARWFWEQVFPGTPMPEAIADLVQKGIDHSPLVEHYTASPSIGVCALHDSVCDAQMVAETGIFFHEAQLRPGNTMTLSIPASPEAAILPDDVAEKVPFANLRDVLAAFNIPPGSAEATEVRNTLRRCAAPPLGGEAMACATSLESTVRSALRMLGGSHGVSAGTSELPRTGLPRQQYLVGSVTPLDGSSYVACHKAPFPYVVYQCHRSQLYDAYVVSLSGLHGGSAVATMLIYCHEDTSGWNPAHPAFKILNTRPGGSPVCHFVPYGDLAFVKKPAHDSTSI